MAGGDAEACDSAHLCPEMCIRDRAIQCALEHGINTFDTAYIYGKGHAEELLGKALRGVRDKCVIITKLWKTDMARERVQPGLEEMCIRDSHP